MKAQLDAVQKRLDPELSAFYSAEVAPGESDAQDTVGMQIFLNLSSLERQLKAINAFAESCDALPPDPTAVKQALDECAAAEVEIAPWFYARRRGF
eukprot:487633-Pyramimonas_sp.AAC.1